LRQTNAATRAIESRFSGAISSSPIFTPKVDSRKATISSMPVSSMMPFLSSEPESVSVSASAT